MAKERGDDERSLARYLKYSHLGFQFLLAVGVPTGLGIWLDRRWGTKVLFTLLGLALGFTAGVYSIYGELFGRRDGRGGKGPGQGGRALTLVCLFLATSALSAFGFWKWRGGPGLHGALLGIALGGAIAIVGHFLRRRARVAQGAKVVSAMMLATFSSFGLFLVAALLTAVVWPRAIAPVLLSALAVYLTVSFHEVLAA